MQNSFKRKTLALSSFFLSFLLFFAANTLVGQTIANDTSVITGTLENGLSYYIKENKEPNERASLRLIVKAGSVLEDDDQQGLAHFIEHMAFNGTEKYPKNDLVLYLESLGIKFGPEINAYTSFDETVYMLEVSNTPEELRTAIDVLNQWAFHISFEQDELDKERGVIVEEWRRRRGAVARMLDDGYKDILNNSQYANRLPIGKVDIIENAPRERFIQYYKDWYIPSQMAIVAVGDFDATDIENNIKEIFSSQESAKFARIKPTYDIDEHAKTIYSLQSDPETSSVAFYLFQQTEKLKVQNATEYQKALTKGLGYAIINQRIQHTIENQELKLLGASWYNTELGGNVSFTTLEGFSKQEDIPAAFKEMLAVVQQANVYGISNEELEREKKSLLTHKENAVKEADKRQSPNLAQQYQENFLNQTLYLTPQDELTLTEELLAKITPEDINKEIANYLKPENYVVLTMSPTLLEEKSVLETQLQQQLAAVDTLKVEPYQSDDTITELLDKSTLTAQEIPSPTKDEATGVFTYKLQNNITVLLKPTDFKNNEILMFAQGQGGNSLASNDNYISALLSLGALNESGLGPYSPNQWSNYLSDKEVNLGLNFADTQRNFSGYAVKKDFEIMWQRLYLYFTASHITQSGWKRYADQVAGSLANVTSTPNFAYQKLISDVLYDAHPRSLPLDLARLGEGNRLAANTFLKSNLASAEGMTFVVVGSLTPEELEPMLALYVANLPTGKKITWQDSGLHYTQKSEKAQINKGLAPKAQATMVFTGNWTWSDEERYKVSAVSSMMNTRLREEIRENLSGTYNISISPQLSRYPSEEYAMIIQFSTDPNKLDELEQAIIDVIQNQFQSGTEGELYQRLLNDLKKQRIKSWEENLKKNSYWIQNLSYEARNELELGTLLNREELINSLDEKDIIRISQQYFDTSRLIQLNLLPEEQ